jgi:hypothetical protein
MRRRSCRIGVVCAQHGAGKFREKDTQNIQRVQVPYRRVGEAG